MNYSLTLKNPISGKTETYTAVLGSTDEIPLILEFWTGAGYEVISVKETGGSNANS
jgi:hypothetical protein